MRVGFVGVGRMGRPMARHLVEAGHEVVAFDLGAAALAAAREDGCTAAASAREAVGGAELAITMLPSPAAVEAAVLGDDGVAAGLAEGAVLADMSTAPPALARRLAQALEPRGIAVLDAPVSGGTIGAEAGTLTIMVGGEAGAVERARPAFDAMGRLVVHVGGHGAGQAAKLCNNLLAGVHMAALGQAVAVARREGLDPRTLYELVTNSTGDSRVCRTRFPAPGADDLHPVNRGFEPMFTVDLMEKDLSLASELVGEHEIVSEPLASALAWYRRAQAEGLGDLDYSAVAVAMGAADRPG
jgi:3-hydroxyisobutyrate dehydrogenase